MLYIYLYYVIEKSGPMSETEAFKHLIGPLKVHFFLSFSSVFQSSFRLCSHCTLWLQPAEDLLFIQHTQVANENSRRSSRTKTHSAHIRRHVIRMGDREQWSEGGIEATDLLTGQLEGANLLSERNIPDRVGMQQGDGPSRGLESREHSPSGAPWGCSCWLIYLGEGERHTVDWVLLLTITLVCMELLLLAMIQEMTT